MFNDAAIANYLFAVEATETIFLAISLSSCRSMTKMFVPQYELTKTIYTDMTHGFSISLPESGWRFAHAHPTPKQNHHLLSYNNRATSVHREAYAVVDILPNQDTLKVGTTLMERIPISSQMHVVIEESSAPLSVEDCVSDLALIIRGRLRGKVNYEDGTVEIGTGEIPALFYTYSYSRSDFGTNQIGTIDLSSGEFVKYSHRSGIGAIASVSKITRDESGKVVINEEYRLHNNDFCFTESVRGIAAYAVRAQKAYVLWFFAAPNDYDKLLPTVTQIFKSFRFVDSESKVIFWGTMSCSSG